VPLKFTDDSTDVPKRLLPALRFIKPDKLKPQQHHAAIVAYLLTELCIGQHRFKLLPDLDANADNIADVDVRSGLAGKPDLESAGGDVRYPPLPLYGAVSVLPAMPERSKDRPACGDIGAVKRTPLDPLHLRRSGHAHSVNRLSAIDIYLANRFDRHIEDVLVMPQFERQTEHQTLGYFGFVVGTTHGKLKPDFILALLDDPAAKTVPDAPDSTCYGNGNPPANSLAKTIANLSSIQFLY